MAALYDVSGHAILTAKARAWEGDPLLFEAQQIVAESMLGLASPAYTDPAVLEKVALAVAMQMNFQAEQGMDPLVLTEVWLLPQKQRKVFYDRYVDPRAAAIITAVDAANGMEVTAARWADMRSYRIDE